MAGQPDEALGWRGPLVASVLGVVLAVGVLEAAARLRPLERVQTIDLSVVESDLVDGVPTWRASDSTAVRMGTACSASPEVALVGSSIFWGSGVADHESLRAQVARHLPEACVRSVAQPAYTFANQAADLSRHLSHHTPRVVVWEVWRNSPNRWTVLGDTAYNFGGEAQHLDDLPVPPGVSGPTHRALFTWSAAYRHLVITHVPPADESWTTAWSDFVDGELAPWVDRLRARDVRVVLALMPALHEPFATAAEAPQSTYPMVSRAVADRTTIVPVAAALAARGVDVETARVDTCCHYSAAGNAELGAVLADAIRPLLADPAPSEAPGAPPAPTPPPPPP